MGFARLGFPVPTVVRAPPRCIVCDHGCPQDAAAAAAERAAAADAVRVMRMRPGRGGGCAGSSRHLVSNPTCRCARRRRPRRPQRRSLTPRRKRRQRRSRYVYAPLCACLACCVERRRVGSWLRVVLAYPQDAAAAAAKAASDAVAASAAAETPAVAPAAAPPTEGGAAPDVVEAAPGGAAPDATSTGAV